MPNYIKKPVVIKAFKFGFSPWPDWFADSVTSKDIVTFNESDEAHHCEIHTLKGIMIGTKGDFIIQGVNNEIYPCKPDIFEKTYYEIK